MLLRNSISNTKKFFQKTLQNFKSLFSGGDSYQRIPKTSPYNNPSSYDMNFVKPSFNSNKDLDKFYADFNDRWDSDNNNNNNIKGKATRRRNKKTVASPPQPLPLPPPPLPTPETKQNKDSRTGSFMKFSKADTDHHHPVMDYQIQRREDYNHSPNNKVKGIKRLEKSEKRDERRSFMLAQKLKELEMMDISNVDHVLDIEEILHYYSRLTCPAYLDIVDKFFMDMYSEFFGPPSTPRSVNSRPLRLPSIRSRQMGRGKLNMELISNEKSRMITYNKRKKGLIKKLQEFHVLCDVDACIIIFGPRFTDRPVDVEAWPVDRREMSRIIRRYQSHGGDRKRNQDLSHFFEARKKKVDDDIVKIRKARMEAKYPAWDDRLNQLQMHELSLLASVLESKIEFATAKILKTRCERDGYVMVGSMNNTKLTPLDPTYNANALLPKHFSCTNQFDHQTVSHHQMLPVLDVDPLNSSVMMMMGNNGDDLSQFSCESSGKRACNMVKEASYFEPLNYHQMIGDMTVFDNNNNNNNNNNTNNVRAHPISYGGLNKQLPTLPYRQDFATTVNILQQPRFTSFSEFYDINEFDMTRQ